MCSFRTSSSLVGAIAGVQAPATPRVLPRLVSRNTSYHIHALTPPPAPFQSRESSVLVLIRRFVVKAI